MEKQFNYVYLITNLINRKQYIGVHSTNNLDDNYFGSGVLLKKAIKKYGPNNFKKEILENCESFKQLLEKEIQYINEYHCIQPSGYNISLGGSGGDTFSNQPEYKKEMIRQSIGKFLRGKTYEEVFGKEKSEIIKKSQSASQKGLSHKPHSEKSKIDIGLFRKNKTYNEIYGNKADLIKEKQIKTRLGRKWIHNENNINKFVKPNELNNYLNIGWKLGAIQK